jgi:hypothetical protein
VVAHATLSLSQPECVIVGHVRPRALKVCGSGL